MNQGWIADTISRKWSILLAGCIFIVGSAIQTSAVDFGMLVAARFIGGIGVGMYVKLDLSKLQRILTIFQASYGRTSLHFGNCTTRDSRHFASFARTKHCHRYCNRFLHHLRNKTHPEYVVMASTIPDSDHSRTRLGCWSSLPAILS